MVRRRIQRDRNKKKECNTVNAYIVHRQILPFVRHWMTIDIDRDEVPLNVDIKKKESVQGKVVYRDEY